MNKRIASTLAAVAVAAGTVTAVAAAGPAAAIDCYPQGAKYYVHEKAGVYRSVQAGALTGLIKYKYPGDYVVGADQGVRTMVKLGDGGYGFMRSDKVYFVGCA